MTAMARRPRKLTPTPRPMTPRQVRTCCPIYHPSRVVQEVHARILLAGPPDPPAEVAIAVAVAPQADPIMAALEAGAESDDSTDTETPPTPPMAHKKIRKMKLVELRRLLRQAGLTTSGRKAACITRLWAHVKAKASGNAPISSDDSSPEPEPQEADAGAGEAGDAADAADGDDDGPPLTVTKTRGQGARQIKVEWTHLPGGIATDVRTAPRNNAGWSGMGQQMVDSMNEMDAFVAAYPGALAGLRAAWANSNTVLPTSTKKFGFGEWLVCWGIELEASSLDGSIHSLFHDKQGAAV